MAVVEFSKSSLEHLLGRKMTEKDYEAAAMLGCPLERVDKQTVAYEIFPNRPDLLSIEGFARALKSLWIEAGMKTYYTAPSGLVIKVEPNVQKVRPAMSAAYIRGVKLTSDSIAGLMQFQEKLAETMGRKRAKAAIGIHDGSKITGPLVYKAVRPDGGRFVPLESTKPMSLKQVIAQHPKGIEYAGILKGQTVWPVITDKSGHIISFPPIINSKATQLSAKTTELFIEVTGTSQATTDQIVAIISAAMADSGAKVYTVNISGRQSPNMDNRQMPVDIDYVNKLLDLDLTPGDVGRVLEKMGIGWNGKAAIIPPYRVDIMHPIDVVEDIAIAMGYEKFEPRIPKVATIARRAKTTEAGQHIKSAMTSLGFQEVVTMILSNEGEQFNNMGTKPSPVCKPTNPLTTECTLCRPALLPSLVKVLTQNRHYELPQKIFELGDILVPNPKAETGAESFKFLSAVICDRTINYNQAASALDAILKGLDIPYSIRPSVHPTFIQGRSGTIFIKNIAVGTIGEINPAVLTSWGLENPVVGFELNISLVMK